MSLKNTIKELLDEAGHNTLQSAFFHEEIGGSHCEDSAELEVALDNASISYECLEQHGGEGEGEDYYTVYQFNTGNEVLYVKFQGWYQSYNGSEMTGWAFVTPKTIEVVVYE